MSAVPGAAESSPAVSSWTEWDPLEEVIVGVIDGAVVPPADATALSTVSPARWGFFQEHGGKPFPADLLSAAERELDGFVALLEGEGITVRRPDRVDHARPFGTPDWTVPAGNAATMPRDGILVVGDLLIECPMAWRTRYFETFPYRRLLREYFDRGARWVSAPKPELRDEFFDDSFVAAGTDVDHWITDNSEITFDAADFARCGRDLFVQRSHVTTPAGIEWLRRLLGDGFRVHEVPVDDSHALHIDASFVPMAPGKLLINPERVPEVPAMFKSWDVLTAPAPSGAPVPGWSSAWMHMNILMLDEQRVVVEAGETDTIEAFRSWGFTPLPCEFAHFYQLGGSFHCATLDVRRRGELRSYF